MAVAANEKLVCGLINGALALIDVSQLKLLKITERAHTGTVVACCALKQSGKEVIVTQDDSREIKVWNVSDMSTPLLKTIGRSYNPVWYSQSLAEFTIPQTEPTIYSFLSACGSESKVVQYRVDLAKKEMVAIQ